tara:strand:- start:188 stop:763 length:576 start_codon:yes stop_codon:yes gene_type:complete
MAYNIKDVFYLSTSAEITKATAGGGSAQLDLSAYIDPIARGRTKGTGLAIYRAQFTVLNSDTTNMAAPDDGEAGIMTMSIQAGAGVGDTATGAIQTASGSEGLMATNALLVSGANYYSPSSYPGAMGDVQYYISPTKDVPYVVVRDNVCLIYNVDTAKKFTDDVSVSVRLECAQISLDQATLNQLLRTQTV